MDLETYLEKHAGASKGIIITREQSEIEDFLGKNLSLFGANGNDYRNVLVDTFYGQNLGNFSFISVEDNIKAIRVLSQKSYSKKPTAYQSASLTACSYLAKTFDSLLRISFRISFLFLN